MKSQEQGIVWIAGLASRAEGRARFSRSLEMSARALCAAVCVSIIDVAMRKVGLVGELTARGVLVAAAVSVLSVGVVAWAWPLPEYSGARALDRFYGLHDGLASALAFSARRPSDRTPFMAAAIEDAIRASRELRPAAAIPIRLPTSVAALAMLGTILAGVMMFEVRRHVAVARVALLAPLDVSPDDIDDVKDFLAQLASRASSDETKTAIEELNRLLADIASQRLDRTEAFRRIEALQMKLAPDPSMDRQKLERELSTMGEALNKSDLSRPVGSALRNADLGKARDALHELAKKVREASAPVDKAKLDELREAMRKAAAANESRSTLERRRRELAAEIDRLKQHAADGGMDEEEQSRLQKDQQELERLDRDLDEQKRSEPQLDRLDRELEQAAEDLAKDLGASSQDLDRGAEDLNRLSQRQLSQQEKEELRQKLTELREVLRQQAAGGKGQMSRLKRFGRLARGQGGGEGGTGNGKQSSGQESEESSGSSPGEKEGQTWILGPDGQKILMVVREPKGSGGEGQGSPGRGWGTGHDPRVEGAATNPKMGTEDTQAQGTDTGQGASRSQVILGASARGFASRGYQKVFTEYHQVAEESLTRDDIPGGYRFYVKRYFQLIRPREEP